MVLKISFTPEEHAELADAAAAYGQDVPTFVRLGAMEKALRPSLMELLATIHDDTHSRRITVERVDKAISTARQALDPEHQAAIDEGLAQADPGEGRPWEEVREELRARFIDKKDDA